LFSTKARSQDPKKVSLYDVTENASAAIIQKTKLAKETGKHLLVQVGNNGCLWCWRFHQFVSSDPAIDSLLKANYILYHLNSSPENKNEKLLRKFRFPQRFGYPVFLVLNGKGELIHTQNSTYLEQGLSYKKELVVEFLNQWSPQALQPARYNQ
jgi:thioredoxin-related protein